MGSPSRFDRHLKRRFALVMNPAAAGGRPLELLGDVRRELSSLGAEHRVIETRDMSHASEAAIAAAAGDEVVVAMGGDGLVGKLAGALRERALLGVLPAGRGNDFARELGIPTDTAAACRLLVEGTERRLDLGEANDAPFICIASAGYDSEANRIANEARLVRGNLVYAYAALRALASWRPATFTVTIDGEAHHFTGYTVAAANTRFYGGGMQVAPEADPSDGLLDVVLIEQTSKLRFLSNLPKVFSAKHVELDGVSMFRGHEVRIEADRQFDVYADGDVCAALPATVRLVPGELRVIAPHR
jgi:YegS/Rv2252/BmrU family lipid kinase